MLLEVALKSSSPRLCIGSLNEAHTGVDTTLPRIATTESAALLMMVAAIVTAPRAGIGRLLCGLSHYGNTPVTSPGTTKNEMMSRR